MRKEEVPQDDANMLQGKFKKLMYATDSSDQYTEIGSVGWEAENVVLEQAWDDINERTEAARQKVLAGKASPIYYYMEKNMMNISLLAGHVSLPAFLVRLHLLPFFYKKLSAKNLEKDAYAFRISASEMQDMERLNTPLH